MVSYCWDLQFRAFQDNPEFIAFVHNQSSNACKINNRVQRLYMFTLIIMMPLQFEQECSPVGCIPPAAVAILGGLHTPLGPGTPPPP